MSDATKVRALHGSVEVVQAGTSVAFTASSPGYYGTLARVDLRLTPGEAVKLSRALVAAAAEALGVAV